MGIFSKKKEITKNTSTNTPKFGWKSLFSFSKINENFYEELEENLIEGDVGGTNSIRIIEKLKLHISEKKITSVQTAKEALAEILNEYIPKPFTLKAEDTLQVYVMVGINGVGKTSTIAKLANSLAAPKDILFGAGDTFRAAAREQLEHWGKQLDIQVIGQSQGTDAASVAYDTIHSAISQQKKFCFIDTAGRLHTKSHLLDQLTKLDKVISKFDTQISKKYFLVLDATQGLSGFDQVKNFQEAIKLDGLILTKLDTMAKGGTLLSICEKLKVPVIYTTHGENLQAISPFRADEYIQSLLGA